MATDIIWPDWYDVLVITVLFPWYAINKITGNGHYDQKVIDNFGSSRMSASCAGNVEESKTSSYSGPHQMI